MDAQLLQGLRAVVEPFPEVKVAYLFGSRGRGDAGPVSDYDVAVFLDERNPVKANDARFRLMEVLSRRLGTDRLDVVLLDSAESPVLKYQVLTEGAVFFEREAYRLLLEPRVLNEYFDHVALLRKNGLTAAGQMTRKEVLEDKLSAARKYLEIAKRYRSRPRADLAGDLDLRGAVERYLYLVAQSAIDLAETVIAMKGLRKPTTMADGFRILQEAGLLAPGLADPLVKMTGFRNVLAHGYEDVDQAVVYDVLQNRLADVEAFLKVVESLE